MHRYRTPHEHTVTHVHGVTHARAQYLVPQVHAKVGVVVAGGRADDDVEELEADELQLRGVGVEERQHQWHEAIALDNLAHHRQRLQHAVVAAHRTR